MTWSVCLLADARLIPKETLVQADADLAICKHSTSCSGVFALTMEQRLRIEIISGNFKVRSTPKIKPIMTLAAVPKAANPQVKGTTARRSL